MTRACLVGVISKGTLHIANVGDSSAVIGSVEHKSDTIIAEKVTTEHNVKNKAIRNELKLLHPNEPDIVVKEIDVWHVIEVSRSVGDVYLKRLGFTVHPSLPQKYSLTKPISEAVLTAEPSLFTRVLTVNDRFIIFASRTFWDLVSMDTATDIVCINPRAGIARKLLKAALKAVIEKNDFTFEDLQMLKKGSRRPFHDDITVIVICLDHHLFGIKDTTNPVAFLKSFVD